MQKGCRACTAALYVPRQDERSSGWIPFISPSSSSCVKMRPVHSDHGALIYVSRVSGSDIHTIIGAVSTARQKWAGLAGSTSVACGRCLSTASYSASRCRRATSSWISCFLVFRVSCIGSVAFSRLCVPYRVSVNLHDKYPLRVEPGGYPVLLCHLACSLVFDGSSSRCDGRWVVSLQLLPLASS